MKLISIHNPSDYFEFTVNIKQDTWVFTFTWNETYCLFHVDLSLNGKPVVYSVAVLSGVFILDKDRARRLGYNFLFLGEAESIIDLGVKIKLYQTVIH